MRILSIMNSPVSTAIAFAAFLWLAHYSQCHYDGGYCQRDIKALDDLTEKSVAEAARHAKSVRGVMYASKAERDAAEISVWMAGRK
jgi:hypothetical protein